jgi:hypothetical protein
MNLAFAKHKKIMLKNHPALSEAWLHERILDDTSLLGLGDLDVIRHERRQYSGGRLDILLFDLESNTRYVVEIMLGATDPSHIIRCIEYWDQERRRYPAYEHIAVLVAEDITTRFLNVMGLLAGTVPLIAIQLDALQVSDSVLLNFVTVLDQRMLREDDTVESGGAEVDRGWWESRIGADKIQLCDRLMSIANAKAKSPLQLRYKKTRISMTPAGAFFNVGVFWPARDFVRMQFNIAEADTWVERLLDAGVDVESPKPGRIRLRLSPAELAEREDLMGELLHQAVLEYEG